MGKMQIDDRKSYDGSRQETVVWDEEGHIILWIEDGIYSVHDLDMESSPEGLEQFALKLIRTAALIRERDD